MTILFLIILLAILGPLTGYRLANARWWRRVERLRLGERGY